MKRRIIMTAAVICTMLLSSCGTENKLNETIAENTVTEAAETAAANNVAGGAETAAAQELDVSGLTALYADSLNDGEYEIDVESSSSMFNIEKCRLIVSGGKMTAEMTMGGKGYLYVFMGKGADAVESGYIAFTENADGKHVFTVPVEALDAAADCSAFSKNKEKWYDRTLVFRSSKLPESAFRSGVLITAGTLGLADGEYTVGVTLSGGSGRASVESPTALYVENGNATAKIVWSSSNYDYMRVGGEKILPLDTEGNSAFIIPVSFFDREMSVSADTTAMSTPHEIEYTLNFSSDSIK